MKFSTKTLAFALLATGGATIWACSSSDKDTGGTSSGSCSDQKLGIQFNPMYSAVVPGAPNKAQVPVILTQNGTELKDSSVTWAASDPSVSLGADSDHPGGTLVTVLSQPSGPVTITGTYKGCPETSSLTISTFTTDDYTAGANRYTNGAAGSNGGKLAIPDGGIPVCTSPTQIAEALKPAACVNCHGAANVALQNLPFKSIEHTPEQTGGFSDQELKDIIGKGKLPIGFTIDPNAFPFGQAFWSSFHQWTATDAELTGLVAYLRTLTPTPQNGTFDIAGLGGDGGVPSLPDAAGCDAAASTTADSGSTAVDAGVADAASE